MKPNPELPWRERLDELLLESRTRTLSVAEREELNATLRANEDARAHAAQMLMDDAALAEKLRAAQMESLLTADSGGMLGAAQSFTEGKRRSGWFQWRPLTAAAAGVVLGVFCATAAWAMASPRAVATASLFRSLVDGSFENVSGRIPSGFPGKVGVWSGDEAEVVSAKAKDGKQALRFVRAEGDSAAPDSTAAFCDVFQVVDLKSLRTALDKSGDTVLELSTEFLDARPSSGASVQFFCSIYLFEGDAATLRIQWPSALSYAVGRGTGALISEGGTGDAQWQRVTARCLWTAQADFAVIHIAAGRAPNTSGPPLQFGRMFADDVKLTIKSQPVLPIRIVQR